jgi:F-type H+-transporting ATPase subunit b
MLIDWFTVVSQLLNFLILVWLMKRFLYKPILNAIETREKKINDKVSSAENEKKEAKQLKEDYQKKNDNFDSEREKLLKQAKEEVQTEREEMLDDVQKETDDLRKKSQKSLQTEQEKISEDIHLQAQSEIFSIARKTLADLAGVKLEEQMTVVLIKRLKGMDDNKKNEFKLALKESTQPAVVRSAFELSDSQKNEIQESIKDIFEVNDPLSFVTTPSLISGIEITVNGRRVTWSIDDYLDALKNNISSIFKGPSAKKYE